MTSLLPRNLRLLKLTRSPRILQPTAPYSTAPKSKKKEKSSSDPRLDAIKNALYPTHYYRPNLSRALFRVIPSEEAHETIENAWKIHKRTLRETRQAELARLYDNMHRAMEVLKETDEYLYNQANAKRDPRGLTKSEIETLKGLKGAEKKAFEARIEGFFPREMRIPTDTPRKAGWDHSWKAHSPEN